MLCQVHWKIKISYAQVHIVIPNCLSIAVFGLKTLMYLCTLFLKKSKQTTQIKYNEYVSLIKLKWNCIQNSQSIYFKIFIVCVYFVWCPSMQEQILVFCKLNTKKVKFICFSCKAEIVSFPSPSVMLLFLFLL